VALRWQGASETPLGMRAASPAPEPSAPWQPLGYQATLAALRWQGASETPLETWAASPTPQWMSWPRRRLAVAWAQPR